jgi:hypothetical protein
MGRRHAGGRCGPSGWDGVDSAEQTRLRVLAAAEELGYVPSSAARSLRLRRTERVCLVVGSIGAPAYDQLARDLSDVADEAGYGVKPLPVPTGEMQPTARGAAASAGAPTAAVRTIAAPAAAVATRRREVIPTQARPGAPPCRE